MLFVLSIALSLFLKFRIFVLFNRGSRLTTTEYLTWHQPVRSNKICAWRGVAKDVMKEESELSSKTQTNQMFFYLDKQYKKPDGHVLVFISATLNIGEPKMQPHLNDLGPFMGFIGLLGLFFIKHVLYNSWNWLIDHDYNNLYESVSVWWHEQFYNQCFPPLSYFTTSAFMVVQEENQPNLSHFQQHFRIRNEYRNYFECYRVEDRKCIDILEQ